ncbi:MAG: PQQ-like beta-propeller repeat protein [Gemmataceae bacterium]|nr:PQQ-like beta-propeller repeat protein [Gemmataceae bacterium]
MIVRTSAAVMFLGLLTGMSAADDWPQFRGPKRDGHSREIGLLQEWPEKGLPAVWTYRHAGLGFSSFAVVGGKLYTLGTRGADEIVIALDAGNGKELWTAKIGPIFTYQGNQWGDGPRGTPTIDGDRLYAIGGQGILVCLDLANRGAEVWRKDFVKDFAGEMMSEWGYSESPLVDGDLVVVTPGGAKGTVVALNKKTGAEVWRTSDLKNKAPYTSAVAAELHGVRQVIQASVINDEAGGVLSGIEAKTGKVLWSTPLYKGHSYAVASSILVTGSTVYTSLLSETLTNCHAFEISPDWKVTDRFNEKSQNAMRNFHGGVVIVGGNVYGHSSGPGWVCQDLKSGKQLWSERNALEGGSGSIIAADGRLYLYSDEGEVVLLQPDPKEWNEQGRFRIPEMSKIPKTRPTSRSSKTWTHPAIANGHLFLRDHELIFCFDIRASK